MPTGTQYKGIKHVVCIRTNLETNCEHCDMKFDYHQFTEAINHYIEQHGYKLLYIGSETQYIEKAIHSFSVAFLGK